MRELPLFGGNGRPPRRALGAAPMRLLTDWTTSAGVDGSGLLALVVGGRAAEGIHLATLGYEVFVVHLDQAAVEAAESAAHVHHVAVEEFPPEWQGRFGLVLAVDAEVPVDLVAAQGLVVALTDAPIDVAGLTVVAHDAGDPDGLGAERHRTVYARL